jgi:hypothetical protein
LEWSLFVHFGGHVRGYRSRGDHEGGAQRCAAPASCICRVQNKDTTPIKFVVSEALFRKLRIRAHIGAYHPHPMSSAGRIAPGPSQGDMTRNYKHSQGFLRWMHAHVPHLPWSCMLLCHRQPYKSPRTTHSHNLSCARMITYATLMHLLMSKCHHTTNSFPQMSLGGGLPKDPHFRSKSQLRTNTW